MSDIKQSAAPDQLMDREPKDIKEAGNAPSAEDKSGLSIGRTMKQHKNRMLIALALCIVGALSTWRISTLNWGGTSALEEGAVDQQLAFRPDVLMSGLLDEVIALAEAKLSYAEEQIELANQAVQKMIDECNDLLELETQAAVTVKSTTVATGVQDASIELLEVSVPGWSLFKSCFIPIIGLFLQYMVCVRFGLYIWRVGCDHKKRCKETADVVEHAETDCVESRNGAATRNFIAPVFENNNGFE